MVRIDCSILPCTGSFRVLFFAIHVHFVCVIQFQFYPGRISADHISLSSFTRSESCFVRKLLALLFELLYSLYKMVLDTQSKGTFAITAARVYGYCVSRLKCHGHKWPVREVLEAVDVSVVSTREKERREETRWTASGSRTDRQHRTPDPVCEYTADSRLRGHGHFEGHFRTIATGHNGHLRRDQEWTERQLQAHVQES